MSKNLPYKAIVFDNTGVLMAENHRRWSKAIADHYQLSVDRIYQNFSRQQAWQLYKRGKITEQKFWQMGNKAMGTSLNLNVLKILARQARVPKRGTVEILKKIKTKFLLGLMNNEGREWDEYTIHKEPFYRYFKVHLASYQSGTAKPEKKIYLKLIRALKIFGIRPEETIYIDDYPQNLIPAKKMGIRTILFRNITGLKKDLAKYGVI